MGAWGGGVVGVPGACGGRGDGAVASREGREDLSRMPRESKWDGDAQFGRTGV